VHGKLRNGRDSMRINKTRGTAIIVACLFGLTACGDNGSTVTNPVAAPTAMTIEVYPALNAESVKPDSIVTVAGHAGRLENVLVNDSTGTVIDGTYSADRTAWVAGRRLAPNERYQVVVNGRSDTGSLISQSTRFSTLSVPLDKRLATYSTLPLDGSTVGVAQPIVVQFNRPVLNRRAVTEALQVTASKPVEGSWYWIDSSTVDYRPKTFWPSGTKVTVAENLVGVDAGADVWGVSRRENSFTVGRSQILKVDVRRHQMKVVRNGRVIRTFDVSTGKPGWETRNGTKVLMEKVLDKKWTNEAIDAPEHYRLQSNYAMRMTNSGEFVHDAPWNSRIGSANTSHGCVGMTTTDMRWVYNNSLVGDPVVVSGSPKKFNELWNRYQDWNVDWQQWLTGNYDLTDG
jgi:lipoprotein-anchoring transpeptidase ErfK/SrfK